MRKTLFAVCTALVIPVLGMAQQAINSDSAGTSKPFRIDWVSPQPEIRSTDGRLGNFQVRVIDSKGIAMPKVQLQVVLGNTPQSLGTDDQITSSTIVTDSNGIASISNVLIGGKPRTVYLAVRTQSGPPTSEPRLVVYGEVEIEQVQIVQPLPEQLENGSFIKPAPRVRVMAHGNPVANVAVLATRIKGDGDLEGVSRNTDAAGYAIFDSLRIRSPCANHACQSQVIVFRAINVVSSEQPINLRVPAVANLVVEGGADRIGSVGIPIGGVRVRVTAADGSRLVGEPVFARDVRGQLVDKAVTGESGIANFFGISIALPAGPTTVNFEAGNVSTSMALTLSAGVPANMAILVQPAARVAYDSVLQVAPVVRLTDAGGNPVAKREVKAELCAKPALDRQQDRKAAERRAMERQLRSNGATHEDSLDAVWVCSDLGYLNASLHGTTTRLTDEYGKAEFNDLKIRGRQSDYRLRFTLWNDGTTKPVMAETNGMSHVPWRDYDQNMIGISAIKTISGKAPDNEFFDLRFRLRLARNFHLLANTDIALSSRTSSDSLKGTQKRLTEAALMFNMKIKDVTSPLSDVPQRQVSAGLQMKVFNTVPYYGFHISGTELGGSALHGSSLSVAYLYRWYPDATLEVDGDSLQIAKTSIGVDFFVRSSLVEFFKILTIRGSIILPLGSKARPTSRIAIAVPIGEVFRF